MDIILIISGLLNVFLGALSLGNNPKSIVNQTFALFTSTTGVWVVSTVLLKLYPSYFTGNVTLILGMSLALSFYMFVKEYPNSTTVPSFSFYLPFIIPFFAMVLGTPFHLLLKDVVIKEGVGEPVFGPLFIVVQVYIFAILPLGIFKLIQNYRKAVYTDKLKMKYLLIALVGFIASVSTFNGILPSLGILQFVNFGTLSAVLWSYILFHAVSRTTLFSLRYMVGIILYHLLRAGFPLMIFYFLIYFETSADRTLTSNFSIILNTLTILVVSIIFPRFSHHLLSMISKYIINTEYDPEQLKRLLAQKITRELDLEKIISNFFEVMNKSLEPKGSSVALFKNSTNELFFVKSSGKDISIASSLNNLLLMLDLNFDKVIIREELYNMREAVQLLNYMQEKDIAVIFPLNIKRIVSGIVLIQNKSNKSAYTQENINFLSEIIENLSLSIERSLLYAELADLNKNLQAKVDQATKELKERYSELTEAYRKERDMIDILGHELRTPLSIARNAVEFIDDLLKTNKLQPEKLSEYIDMAMENLQREVKLLETLLSATKTDNKKLQLRFTKVDYVDVINDSLQGLSQKAQDKNLGLTFTKNQDPIFVYADRERIQEIADNLIDNAIKYTNTGKVEINLYLEQHTAILEVRDTGIGIPQKDLPNLGKKFYRVSSYIKNDHETDFSVIRPGGTGLGLYVTFALVKAMNGDILVESEVGKGSVFTVRLPAYNNQPIEKEQAQPIKTLDKIEELRLKNKISAN